MFNRFLKMRTLLVILMALGTSFPAAAKTFKIATLLPDGTNWMREMRAAGKQIDKETAGRVKLKFYPGGIMGSDSSVLRKMRIGQLQGGAFAGGSLNEIHPDSQLYSLPFLFRNEAEVEYVRERMDSTVRGALEKEGMIVLGLGGGGFAYFMSNTPVASTADLQGQKVWVPEGDLFSETALRSLNVSPIPLPISDVYTSLQTGLVNAVGTSPAGAIALQWHSKVKYLTDVPIGYLVGYLTLNERDFKRVSPADQAVVRRLISESFQRVEKADLDFNRKSKIALKGAGIEFVSPSPADLQRWRQVSTDTIAKLKGQGTYTEANLNRLLALLAEFRAQNAQ